MTSLGKTKAEDCLRSQGRPRCPLTSPPTSPKLPGTGDTLKRSTVTHHIRTQERVYSSTNAGFGVPRGHSTTTRVVPHIQHPEDLPKSKLSKDAEPQPTPARVEHTFLCKGKRSRRKPKNLVTATGVGLVPRRGVTASPGSSCHRATTRCPNPGHHRSRAVSGVMGPVLNLRAKAGRAGGRAENISEHSRGVRTEEEEQR